MSWLDLPEECSFYEAAAQFTGIDINGGGWGSCGWHLVIRVIAVVPVRLPVDKDRARDVASALEGRPCRRRQLASALGPPAIVRRGRVATTSGSCRWLPLGVSGMPRSTPSKADQQL